MNLKRKKKQIKPTQIKRNYLQLHRFEFIAWLRHEMWAIIYKSSKENEKEIKKKEIELEEKSKLKGGPTWWMGNRKRICV